MSISFGNKTQNCATCAMWGGIREVASGNTRVSLKSSCEKGKCLIPKGSHRNMQMSAGHSGCKDWQKWSVLK